ncbi:MAG: hypothetical protein ACPLW5_00620 [Candidatus Bathyarchaeales archaeon]
MSLILIVGSIIFALTQNNWNISPLLQPEYSSPKIGFNVGAEEVKAEADKLTIICELENNGEIGIELYEVQAIAYTLNQEALTQVYLESPVSSQPSSKENVALTMPLNDSINQKILLHLQKANETTIRITGQTVLMVMGSKVTAPFEVSFQLKIGDLTGLTGD